MSSAKGSSMSEMIPQDVVFLILLWLPVASLLRFKSVCKSWLSLIESSDFISRHLRLSPYEENQETKLVVKFTLKSGKYAIKSHRPPSFSFITVDDIKLCNHIKFTLRSHCSINHGELIATFHGIICLKNTYAKNDFGAWADIITLWNPATKSFKVLPPPLQDMRSDLSVYRWVTRYGFGFDVETNDYKVVRIIVEDKKARTSAVEVYNLSTDSWRAIDAAVPLNIIIESSPKTPFQDGTYCWLGRYVISEDLAILTFDFSRYVFGTLPVPYDYNSEPEGHQILAFLKGKLALIQWIPDSSETGNRHCIIWVFDKCGVNESWTKLYTIMLEAQVRPIGFSLNCKIVLVKIKPCRKVSFLLLDPAGQELNDVLEFDQILPPWVLYEAAGYGESLVSVQGERTGPGFAVKH